MTKANVIKTSSKILLGLLLAAPLTGTEAVVGGQAGATVEAMAPTQCREFVPLTKGPKKYTPMVRKISGISFAFNNDAQLVMYMKVTKMPRPRRAVMRAVLPLRENLVFREGNRMILNIPSRPIIATKVWWADPQWVLKKGVSMVRDVDVDPGTLHPLVRVNSISLCLQ